MKEQDYDQGKYIALDLDAFFRENDEFTMLKTLQEMYVSSYRLELEIKSLVTDELDSVLVFVDTILEMCSLIKGSKSNLDALKKMLDESEFDRRFEEERGRKEGSPDPAPQELQSRLRGWMEHFSPEPLLSHALSAEGAPANPRKMLAALDLDELVTESQSLNAQTEALAAHHLASLTMSNYRLLKSNQLLRSYEWLFAKAPGLLELLERLGAAELGRLRRETERMREFYRRKLDSHCLANLGSTDHALLLESLAVLLLLHGRGPESVASLLRRRLELFQIATSHLPLGSPASLSALLTHLFANELVLGVLARVAGGEPGLAPGPARASFEETYEPKLLEHFNSHALGRLVELKRLLLEQVEAPERASAHLDPGLLATARERLRSLVAGAWRKSATEKILSSTLAISVSINNRMRIRTDVGDFSEYFDNQDFAEHTQSDLESTIEELNCFLSSQPDFKPLVGERVDSMAQRADVHVGSLSFEARGPDSLTLHSLQAYNRKFKKWMEDNGLLHSLLVLNRLDRTEKVDALYKNIASKYLEPLVGRTADAVREVLRSVDNFEAFKVTDSPELGTGGGEERSPDPAGTKGRGHEDDLYMVKVVYAAANLRSSIDELNGFRRCAFTGQLEESAALSAMESYLALLEGRSPPRPLERDAAVLALIWRDRFEGTAPVPGGIYEEFKSRTGPWAEHEGFHGEFRALV